MDVSKLNISSIAKEEIRRKFFDTCSVNIKSMDKSGNLDKKCNEGLEMIEDKARPKVNQEVVQTVKPQILDETSTRGDDGFPLIISVFSLASSSRKTDTDNCVSAEETCGSSDERVSGTAALQRVANTPIPCCNDVPLSSQSSLPFVVHGCPNGVVPISYTPNSISTPCNFEQKDSTTITSNVKGSVCSTELSTTSTNTSEEVSQAVATGSQASATSNSSLSATTFPDATRRKIIPLEKPAPEVEEYWSICTFDPLSKDNTACLTSVTQTRVRNSETTDSYRETSDVEPPNHEDSASTCVSDSESAVSITESESNSLLLNGSKSHEKVTHQPGIEDNYTNPPLRTKQDEKISQLKDLLRKKEAELEKFRFKGKSASFSAAAQLRENFLRKNPSLCQSNVTLDTTRGTVTGNEFSSAHSNEVKVTSETESPGFHKNLSQKDGKDVKTLSSCSKERKTKFTNEDKYKLVNVTILQGHTRTLAVPLEKVRLEKGESMCQNSDMQNKTLESIARKRKQDMPRKIAHSKRKSNSKESMGSALKLNKTSSDSSAVSLVKHLSGISTTASPQKKEEQSFKTAVLKRKSPDNTDIKKQVGTNALKKVPKIVTSTKSLMKSFSLPTKLNTSITPLINIKSGQTQTIPRIVLTTLANNPTQISTSMTEATENASCVVKYPKEVASVNTAGENVSDILYPNETVKTASAPSQKVVKPKQVFALVSKLPGRSTANTGERNSSINSSVAHLPGEGKVVAPNVAAVATQISKGSYPSVTLCSSKTLGNCTISTNTTTTSKLPVSMLLSLPIMNAHENELANVGIFANNTGADSHIPKVVVPSDIGKVNDQTGNTVKYPLTQPLAESTHHDQLFQNVQANVAISTESINVSCPVNRTNMNTAPSSFIPVNLGIANGQKTSNVTVLTATVVSPIPAITVKNQVNNISITNQSSSTISPATSILFNNPHRVPAVVAINDNTHTSSSLKSHVPTAVTSTKTSQLAGMTTRPLAPKTNYCLAVPVAVGNRVLAKTNIRERPLAPKPTTLQNASSRPLVPKPSACQITIPVAISRKFQSPEAQTTIQYTLPQPSKPTSSQSISTKPAASEPPKQVIYTLPGPVMTVPTSSSPSLPQNLSNGKILVYDVVESSPQPGEGNSPVVNKDAAKLVVYVANTGESRNLGIIKDNKIYLNTNQVAAVASKPEIKSPASSPEFIPNPEDADFKVLLGLEHLVHSMT